MTAERCPSVARGAHDVARAPIAGDVDRVIRQRHDRPLERRGGNPLGEGGRHPGTNLRPRPPRPGFFKPPPPGPPPPPPAPGCTDPATGPTGGGVVAGPVP